jgi:hypothetical protein
MPVKEAIKPKMKMFSTYCTEESNNKEKQRDSGKGLNRWHSGRVARFFLVQQTKTGKFKPYDRKIYNTYIQCP